MTAREALHQRIDSLGEEQVRVLLRLVEYIQPVEEPQPAKDWLAEADAFSVEHVDPEIDLLAGPEETWPERLAAFRATIAARGVEVPTVADMLNQLREERFEELSGLR